MGAVVDPQPPSTCAMRFRNHVGMSRHRFDLVSPLIVAVLLATTGRAALAECPTQRVGQWGGASKTLAAQGDFAYVGIGAKLVVLDISNPQEPTPVGSLLLNGVARDIAVSGQHAYVCTDGISLEIIDISNPAEPTRVGQYVTVYPSIRVVVEGQYAYVLADNNIQFGVVDVSDPATPVLVGDFDVYCPVDQAMTGNYAYVCRDGCLGGTVLLDISNPEEPALVSTIGSLGNTKRMLASEDRLYTLEASGASFRIYDISDPASPILLGHESIASATALDVVGNLAFLASNSGLFILDVSNPADPEIVGQSDGPHYSTDVVVHGDRALVTHKAGAVQLIDVSDPQSPQLQGSYRESGPLWSVAISGTHAYLGGDVQAPALQVLDLTEPTTPTLSGESMETINLGYALTIRDGIAYLASPYDGLLIYDIADPGLPTLLGVFNAVPTVSKVAVDNSTTYLLSGGGFHVVDVSNPSMPELLGQLYGWYLESAEAVAVHGNAAYVMVPYEYSLVIDVSDPSLPVIAGVFPDSYTANDVEVSEGLAFLLGYGLGLTAYDVADPLTPIKITTQSGPYGSQVTVQGSLAYTLGSGAIVDVSDPAVPTTVGSLIGAGYPAEVDILGSYAYVASYDAGLNIFRTCIPADANCDGRIDGLDVAAFAQALLGPGAYQSAHPFCNMGNTDVNQDGDVSEADIAPFVEHILSD